jgi:hypothetical protein
MLAPVSSGRKDGRSSFRTLSRYLLEQIDPETEERMSRGEFILSDNLQNFDDNPENAIQIAPAIMRATASRNLNTPDPIFHFQLCLQPGEKMSSQQFDFCVKYVLSALTYEYKNEEGKKQTGSYADHQFIAGKHTDKAFDHAHAMVNRVHPERLTAHTPAFYERALDKCCRELEQMFGWRESHGLFRWDHELNQAVGLSEKELDDRRKEKAQNRRAEGKAGDLEYYGNSESVMTYVRRTAAAPLRKLCEKPQVRWKDVHELLAKYELELHKGEGGGYTVERLGTGVRVKASKVFRASYHKNDGLEGVPGVFCGNKNRTATEERLGAWEPMSVELRNSVLGRVSYTSEETWAKQTGGYSALDEADKRLAAAAYDSVLKMRGTGCEALTIEHFVAKCQEQAERRAAKEAERQEPKSWKESAARTPDWVRISGGYATLTPEQKSRAEEEYSVWTKKNPQAAAKHTIDEYVEFKQQRFAQKAQERRRKRDESRAIRESDRLQLNADFAAYKEQCRAQVKEHAENAKTRVKRLRDAANVRKSDIRAEKGPRWAVKVVQLRQVDRECRQAVYAAIADSAVQRTMLVPMTRQQWVAMRAEQRDERAIRQLRGWRYQNARARKSAGAELNSFPSLSAANPSDGSPATWARVYLQRIQEEEAARQKDISEALSTITHSVNRCTGDVSFFIRGKEAIVDRGKILNVVDQSEAAHVLALEMAARKFGAKLTAYGSDEFKKSIAITAARNQIKVEFADETMNSVMREELTRLQEARDAASRPVQTAPAPTLPERNSEPLELDADVEFVGRFAESLVRGKSIPEIEGQRALQIVIAASLLTGETKKSCSLVLKQAQGLIEDLGVPSLKPGESTYTSVRAVKIEMANSRHGKLGSKIEVGSGSRHELRDKLLVLQEHFTVELAKDKLQKPGHAKGQTRANDVGR